MPVRAKNASPNSGPAAEPAFFTAFFTAVDFLCFFFSALKEELK